jgi:hypothetical protein
VTTLITKYLDTGSTAGGTGDAPDLTGASRAFASLEEFRVWLTTNHPSFVTNDVQVDLFFRATGGVQDTAPLSSNGVHFNQTMDVTRYLRILPLSGSDNALMPLDTSRYRLVQGNSFYHALTLTSAFVEVRGLQIVATGSRANGNRGIVVNRQNGGVILLRECLGVATSTGTTPASDHTFIRSLGNASGTVKCINCCSIDWGRGFYAAGAGSTTETNILYNCAFYRTTVKGIDFVGQGSTVNRMKNLILTATSGSCYPTTGLGGTHDFVDILTSDATSPEVGNRNVTPTFVDDANGDFTPASGDTLAKGQGTDLSADASHPFSVDLEQATRSAPWDIGPVKAAAGGGGPSPVTGSGTFAQGGFALSGSGSSGSVGGPSPFLFRRRR